MSFFPRLDSRQEAAIVETIRASGGGKTINGWARELGRAHKLIERIVREHDLPVAARKLVTPPLGKCDSIERLAKLGWADVEIADELKLPRHAVNRAKELLGMRGRVLPPPAALEKARRLAAAGAPAEALVLQTGIPPGRAKQIEREAKRSIAKDAIDKVWLPARLLTDADGNKLYVASAAMYRLHEASLLTRVADRAGIDVDCFYKWQRQLGKGHWLFGWLRGGRPPDGVTIKLPSRQRRMTRGPAANEFFVSHEQQAFRREAMPAAVEKAAACQRGRWLRRFPELTDWMLSGADAPHRTLTVNTARRLALGWHVRSITRGANLHRQTFDEIRDRLPRQGFAHWLAWLFGGKVPEGWTIVDQRDAAKKKLRRADGPRTGTTGSGAINASFVASPAMLAFRSAARQLRNQHRLVEIENGLSADMLRRLLFAFVLTDVPSAKKILTDHRTLAGPEAVGGSATPRTAAPGGLRANQGVIFSGQRPSNDVVDLAIQLANRKGESKNAAALRFFNGNKKKARSFLAQITQLVREGRISFQCS